MGSCSDDISKARLLAAQAPHSGDWLNALLVSSCGLRLDDEAVRVAIGLRLGVNLCAPHGCPCSALVDALGIHGLSCRGSAGRTSRHNMLNDIIFRACIRFGGPGFQGADRYVLERRKKNRRNDVGSLESGQMCHMGYYVSWHARGISSSNHRLRIRCSIWTSRDAQAYQLPSYQGSLRVCTK